MHALNKKTRRFVLGPHDSITIDGRRYRWLESDDHGHSLTAVSSPEDGSKPPTR
jgi:hypothetical protein